MYIGMCEGNFDDLHMGICLISVCLGICICLFSSLFLLNFHEIGGFFSKK